MLAAATTAFNAAAASPSAPAALGPGLARGRKPDSWASRMSRGFKPPSAPSPIAPRPPVAAESDDDDDDDDDDCIACIEPLKVLPVVSILLVSTWSPSWSYRPSLSFPPIDEVELLLRLSTEAELLLRLSAYGLALAASAPAASDVHGMGSGALS